MAISSQGPKPNDYYVIKFNKARLQRSLIANVIRDIDMEPIRRKGGGGATDKPPVKPFKFSLLIFKLDVGASRRVG